MVPEAVYAFLAEVLAPDAIDLTEGLDQRFSGIALADALCTRQMPYSAQDGPERRRLHQAKEFGRKVARGFHAGSDNSSVKNFGQIIGLHGSR